MCLKGKKLKLMALVALCVLSSVGVATPAGPAPIPIGPGSVQGMPRFPIERFYVVPRFYQDSSNRAQDSHTYFDYVRVVDRGTGRIDLRDIEVHTISWLPEDFTFTGRLPRFLSTEGRNYSSKETILMAQRKGLKVGALGAFPIDRELYFRALRRIHLLNAGNFMYKMIDNLRRRLSIRRDSGVLNCIGASSIAGAVRSGFKRGSAATKVVFDSLLRDGHVLNTRSQNWLLEALRQKMVYEGRNPNLIPHAPSNRTPNRHG